jgi:PTS system fructose-specific IIA component
MTTVELTSFLDPRLIRLDLAATTREGAIRELTETLAATGHVEDPEGFVQDVLAREELGATGLGRGIAIPHGKSAGVRETTVAIGRTASPLTWPSLDGEPVTEFILFAVREEDADTTHLRLLQKVAILLASDDFIRELHEARTADEVVSLITTRTKESDQ